MKYNRILLKLSGEALAADKKTGFDEETCMMVGRQVKQLTADGVQTAVVIGGGNFLRGRSTEAVSRAKADQIGMLATVMNCIYVSEIFKNIGIKSEIYTPFSCGGITKIFSKDDAEAALNQEKTVFLAGGTGHPYFSTDTAAALYAVTLEADIIMMARAVDGVYDSDPKINKAARKYTEISLKEIIDMKLGILDMTASVLCMENKMPLLVFSLNEADSIINNGNGRCTGTVVTS